ncbi:sigma-54 dependent transcriptional regulator [Crenobacter cavernae]|uniref:Sigma-54-dependent Fis family transcriptional regulator n=1 Tax=Crenobacter cavernae TaxID=2290923 RepID=A0A345Y9I8_9NEIS|nr:sigma-54 dependent transcriptional regulator [Crenobacter cavernae]AXK40590.1 sigma-54-dependent Fis family transcriptional regulator [Crenobacter cavernae]
MSQREVLVLGQRCVGVAEELTQALPGWRIITAHNVGEALASIGDLVRPIIGLIHIDVNDIDPLNALENISVAAGVMEWIALVEREHLSAGQVCHFISDHCYDFHTLPLDASRLAITLGHAHGRAELRLRHSRQYSKPNQFNMVGSSEAMKKLFASLGKVSGSDAPVLVHGESGTGKELVAKAVHMSSPRADGPFIAVNCGAIPAHLVQTELFGHEKGAFTGAHQRKIGLIESSNGGTIFLDEIGDLPLDLQVNFLRFLQEKTIERVGSVLRIGVDVRVIAATHVDLGKAIAEKRFREDLYYRLSVLVLSVPPLRERCDDIEILARWCFNEFSLEKNSKVQGFSNKALQVMRDYSWPGNVRELINRVRSAMVMSESRLIRPEDLGLIVENGFCDATVNALDVARGRLERSLIQQVLQLNKQNVAATARQLGLSRSTLYRMMNKLELQKE